MSEHIIPDRPPPPETLISVVLPVYNEAEVLPELLQRVTEAIAGTGADCEIIFVNDGSQDNSPQVLDRLAAEDPRAGVIHLSRNFGHQAAIQAGIVHARGDAVVLMDSDLQDAPEAIGRFVEQWRAGSDVVYAVRTQRKERWWKRLMFAAFHRLMSAVATVPIPTDAGNFGLVDRRVAREIVALGESDRYFPGLRCWVGFEQQGVEVRRDARYDDSTRVSLGGLFRLAKTAIFSFSSFPLMIFYAIGLLATGLFISLSGFSLFCKLFTDQAVPGWTSHILASSFFGALNALGICILGEYVIRIYDQVRDRPLYLIDRTVNLQPGNLQPDDVQGGAETAGEADRSGDAAYLELMEEAVRLLEAGTIRETPTVSDESASEPCEPVIFPLNDD